MREVIVTKLTGMQRSAAAKRGWLTRWKNEARERAEANSRMYGYPDPSDVEVGWIQSCSKKEVRERRRFND